MKLVSCYIENYGAISRKEYNFNEGITEFLSANGTGKTTLASFIKAMFYGLPSFKANAKSFDDRQRFYPFNGGKFGGNLTFSYGGAIYRIERFFDKKSSVRDELRLFKNGKPCDSDGEIGKAVFGLDVSAFGRTVFITADEIEINADGDIGAKLNRTVSAEDDYSLENALKSLEIKRKEIKADRGRGGLLEREKELRQTLAEEIADLKELEKGLSEKYDERNALQGEISELIKKVNELNGQRLVEEKWATYDRYLSDLKEKRSRIAELDGVPEDGALAELNAKCAELEKTEELLKTLSSGDIAGATPVLGVKSNTKKYLIIAVLAIALLVGGVCACFLSLVAGIALIAAGLVGLFLDGFLYLKMRMDTHAVTKTGDIAGVNAELCKSYRERVGVLKAELSDLLEGYNTLINGDIRGAIDKLLQKRQLLNVLIAEERELSARAERYKAESGLNERAPVCGDADEAEAELEEKRKRLALLDRQISEDEERVERLPFKENGRDNADSRIENLKEQYELIALTEGYLREADKNLKDRFVKPVKDAFDFYAAEIEAVFGKLIMTEDFSLVFESGGEIRSGKHLSAGQRAVCGLCLRLALIDNMYGEEKPFIIMDDPFVNLDGENLSGVLKVLKKLAKKTQIVYFTCHNSRAVYPLT